MGVANASLLAWHANPAERSSTCCGTGAFGTNLIFNGCFGLSIGAHEYNRAGTNSRHGCCGLADSGIFPGFSSTFLYLETESTESSSLAVHEVLRRLEPVAGGHVGGGRVRRLAVGRQEEGAACPGKDKDNVKCQIKGCSLLASGPLTSGSRRSP